MLAYAMYERNHQPRARGWRVAGIELPGHHGNSELFRPSPIIADSSPHHNALGPVLSHRLVRGECVRIENTVVVAGPRSRHLHGERAAYPLGPFFADRRSYRIAVRWPRVVRIQSRRQAPVLVPHRLYRGNPHHRGNGAMHPDVPRPTICPHFIRHIAALLFLSSRKENGRMPCKISILSTLPSPRGTVNMPRFSAIAPAALLIVALGTSTSFAQQLVTVPGGTSIKVRATESISSATAHKGDVLEIRSIDPVILNGWVVVPENSQGQAEVVDAEPAGKHGHPGKLLLKYDWIYSADGGRIQLSDVSTTQSGQNAKGSSSTATIAGTVLLGPVGLFAHNFVKGHDVVLDGDKTLTCVVDHTVHVQAVKRSAQTESYDH